MEWSIITTAKIEPSEVLSWVLSRSGWAQTNDENGSDEVKYQDIINLRIVDLSRRKGTAANMGKSLGSSATYSIDMGTIKNPDMVGRKDVVYKLAFDFASYWSADVEFCENYDVVFRIKSSETEIDPKWFLASSIAKMLPDKYSKLDSSVANHVE